MIDFLAKYQSTPHTITNSELLNNGHLRTILDLLHPCQSDTAKNKERQKSNYDLHTTPRKFVEGDCKFVEGDPVWA